MLRYGVDDLRLFFEDDLRFLRQFAEACMKFSENWLRTLVQSAASATRQLARPADHGRASKSRQLRAGGAARSAAWWWAKS